MSLFDEYYAEYSDLVKRTGELTAELLNSNPFSQDAHKESAKVRKAPICLRIGHGPLWQVPTLSPPLLFFYLLKAIESTLEAANDVVKQMEIHARGLRKPQNRSGHTTKLQPLSSSLINAKSLKIHPKCRESTRH